MPIRPLYDVTDEIGGDRSKGRPRLLIRSPLRPIVHVSPFPPYAGSKFDRKRFRPDDDVTGPITLTNKKQTLPTKK